MIVHIFLDEKFIDKYISFVNSNFDKQQHIFLVMCSRKKLRYSGAYTMEDNVKIVRKNIAGLWCMLHNFLFADKIVFHGVFVKPVAYILGFKYLARKTYVALWGGDIYSYYKATRLWNRIKQRLLSRCAGIICELEEDYQLTCKLFHVSSQYFSCMMYLSNIVNDEDLHFHKTSPNNEKLRVLVGNSADPENNHLRILEKLKRFAEEVQLVLPLSYGDQAYANRIESYVFENFGDNSIVLRDFMPIEEYKTILKSIDVAVFAHDRQQALGNTLQLLAFGKKVYLNGNITTYKWMLRKGIRVFDSNNIDDSFIYPLDVESAEINQCILAEESSIRKLREDWKRIFDDKVVF